MSLRRDWNDMSDDDSEEDHHHQQEHEEELKDLPQQLPALNKIVSSPLPQKKPANQQENLKKLQNCKKDQIWLYVPLFYKDNVNQVDKVLRTQIDLKKIDKFSKGWNVLTSKQNAKTYIIEGKKQGKFFIKFYFSNKNQDNENKISSYKNLDNMGRNNDNDGRKVKYIPKSPKSRQQLKDLRSPQSFRKKQSQNDYDDSITPKSPTYKNQQSKKYDDYRSKNYNSKPSLKRLDSKGSDSFNIDSKGYRQKYASKNQLEQNTPYENSVESPRKKYKAKAYESKKQQTAVETNESIQVEKNQEASRSELQQEKQVGDQLDSPTMVERKPKKKRTKKDQPLKDSNNPFSMLM